MDSAVNLMPILFNRQYKIYVFVREKESLFDCSINIASSEKNIQKDDSKRFFQITGAQQMNTHTNSYKQLIINKRR